MPKSQKHAVLEEEEKDLYLKGGSLLLLKFVFLNAGSQPPISQWVSDDHLNF